MKLRAGLMSSLILLLFSLGRSALAAGFTGPAPTAFTYVLDTKNVPANLLPAMQTLLAEAAEKLPPLLKDRIGQSVPVHFIPTKDAVVGMAHRNKKEIDLSTSLLPELLKNLPLDHSNLMLATILHETTHLYDDAVTLSEDDRELLERCNDLQSQSPGCRQLRNPTVLSSQAAFRRVSGWYGSKFVFTFRQDDAYEATNPRETLAVNMEYFLLDPGFACRKPSLNRFFSSYFQWRPFPEGSCQLDATYVNSLAASPKEVLAQLPIDRIYEIDYLLAGKGSALESRFGHSMLRLVVCPPGKPLNEDCRKNISEHLVLSFRASVTDFHTSALKGIVGDYPSRLFILPLTEVIQEYPSGELRDLTAYPLKLTALEKQKVLERALEYHWNYQGRYYFLTNNCADEAVNLLASATQRPDLLKLAVATPTGLLKDLIRMKLVDTEPLADLNAAKINGLYFESYQARYDMAFAVIQKFSGQKYDMNSWQQMNSDERYALFNQELPLATAPKDRQSLAAAYFMLESALLKKTENSYLNWMAGQLLQKPKDGGNAAASANQIADDAKEYLFVNSQLVNPSAVLVGQKGYGLPSGEELSATADSFAQLNVKYQSMQAQMISTIKSLFDPGLQKELQQTQTHVKNYLQMISTKPITKGINHD
jgi:hypothetical protein